MVYRRFQPPKAAKSNGYTLTVTDPNYSSRVFVKHTSLGLDGGPLSESNVLELKDVYIALGYEDKDITSLRLERRRKWRDDILGPPAPWYGSTH